MTDIPNGNTTPPVVIMSTALAVGVSVNPIGPIDFGTVAAGGSSEQPTTITFTNCNPQAVTISSATITGDPDFVLGELPSLVVETNGQARFPVVLSPRFGGFKVGSLEIVHDGGVSIVSLIGNGDGELAPDPTEPRDTYYACNAAGGPGNGASGGSVVLLALGFVLRRRRITRP